MKKKRGAYPFASSYLALRGWPAQASASEQVRLPAHGRLGPVGGVRQLAHRHRHFDGSSRRAGQLVELLGVAMLVLGSKQYFSLAIGLLRKSRLSLGMRMGMQV